ncbi:hypothetical protein TrLO_g1019 [Triparma laevis f. longispina]|uniref:Uncharacterized protein n=1 Tax=Triparma laevis f. longispina TaxID=1714387 RepID=A0A9W7AMP9_9STRA|nr:hypothetical protein TrLO_g1019 [Triparma laevis f. longispina]
MATVDFKRLLIGFILDEMLMSLRLTTKAWKAVAEEVIDEGVSSGSIIVHGGKDIRKKAWQDREVRRKLVKRMVFFLNVTNIGVHACCVAINLVVVDIPEGVEIIGAAAFQQCVSLTTVSFPTTLKLIGIAAFASCPSLDDIDLLYTKLRELVEKKARGKKKKKKKKKKTNDPKKLEILDACMALGGVCGFVGDFDDARRYLKRAKEGYEEQLGRDDKKMLEVSRGLIMSTRSSQGEKIEKSSDLLKRMERVLGEENVVTLETLNDLGGMLDENGEHEEAIKIY